MVLNQKNSAVSVTSAAKAFTVGEKRVLRTQNAELGTTEVEHVGRDNENRYRFYRGTGVPPVGNEDTGETPVLHVQLNHGDPDDDEQRLVEIMEDILRPEELERTK